MSDRSEEVDLGAVLARIALSLLSDVVVGRWQRHHLLIVVVQQFSCLIICVLEPVRAQTGLIHDQVSDMLSMLNSLFGVVDPLMSFVVASMEAKLDLVYAVGEAENGQVCSLDS